ncbi:MAG: nucleotidyltransferase family protein [Desulfatitalea sp.]|nr:nucleotidyltransferase family protein [Desulfatitalea sp.]
MTAQVNTKDDVIRQVLDARERLSLFGVKSLGVFGSFVRNAQTPESDVDILVEFYPGKHTFDNFMEVSFFLEQLFGRRVELITLEGLSPHIGPHILKEVQRVPIAA